jgi:hypothetical protein
MENLPIGTKVFDICFGWGEIYEYKKFRKNDFALFVDFNKNKESYTINGKYRLSDFNPTLSLTEYDLINGGFTPLSDYGKPEKFDVGYFWDYEESGHELFYSQILKIEESEYITSSFRTFKNFSKEVPEWFTKRINPKF